MAARLPGFAQFTQHWCSTVEKKAVLAMRAEEEVEAVIDEDLALLPELLLDLVLAGAREVGGALADAAQGEGVPLARHLLGVVGRRLVDGGAGELLAGVVAAVLQLVVARVEGERLHDVGSGAQELAVQLQNWISIHIAVLSA